ncbi:MAG: hypothetical protein MJE68_16815 [Proteobacteria bacterium]|nr:hypothetical protein [Pseudomonadota bacterium]
MNSKGIGRSLGYGFVEFSSHEAALAALLATNNNPAIFGDKRVSYIILANYFVVVASELLSVA